jgi:hypothetical protein
MTAVLASLLDTLKADAARAGDTEAAYRSETVQRIAVLERERSFAFRRLNLMRAVIAALAGVETEEEAVARAATALCETVGWDAISEARTAVIEQFTPVAKAVFAEIKGEPDPSASEERAASYDGPTALAALAAFEAWYRETHTGPFWALFDQYRPQTSVVDF